MSDDQPTSDTKTCPYCAETVLAAAVVCKHCGRDLATGVAPAAPATPVAVQKTYNPGNSTGLWAMIWGIIGFFLPFLVFPQVVALVMGIKGNGKVKKGLADNKGQAVTGIVLGALGCISTAVIVLIFGSALIATLAKSSTSEPAATTSTSSEAAATSGGSPANGLVTVDGQEVPGISQGTGGPTLVLWADPQSPAVGALNAANGSTLTTLAGQGKVTVVLRPATFLDRNLGNDASTRAVAALGCAADQGKGWEFWNNLVSHQPGSEGAGWTNEELATIGAGAGADEAAMASCISSGQYAGWATSSNDAFLAAGIAGVPYATLDGTEVAIENLADGGKLTKLVESGS